MGFLSGHISISSGIKTFWWQRLHSHLLLVNIGQFVNIRVVTYPKYLQDKQEEVYLNCAYWKQSSKQYFSLQSHFKCL